MKHSSSELQPSGGCPVKHSGAGSSTLKKKNVYNVYGEIIDPSNNMPSNPNQNPHEEQKFPLPTNRVVSGIPKGGVDGTWVYPSEQMFFNSMKRKGKGEDVHEGQVSTIVAIHNNMNERTWAQVQAYEATCHPELPVEPRLVRFLGRPDDLTPLARMYSWFGFGTPFDRHDWIVERASETPGADPTYVRYVIDYYFDEAKSARDKTPSLHSVDSIQSISVYARPALDSFTSVLDRVKYPILQRSWSSSPVPSSHPPVDRCSTATTNVPTAAPSTVLTAADVDQHFSAIHQTCAPHLARVKSCESEDTCAKAAMALQHCMASILCHDVAEAFTAAVAKQDERAIERSFDQVNRCILEFEQQAQPVLEAKAVDAASKL